MNIFDYISPESESSIYKGIPMRYRDNIVIRALAYSGCRLKYRGPRRPSVRGQATCLVEHATTFAIYPKG